MNNLINVINKKYPNSNNYLFYNNSIIFTNNDIKYVIKNNTNDIYHIYKYLNSRGFDYLPNIVYQDDISYIYEYIPDLKEPDEQKVKDLVLLMALLHNKTSYHKEISLDNIKELYEKLSDKIQNTYNYYVDIITMIENNNYFSPSEYMLARNISSIFNALEFSKNILDNWYEKESKTTKKREVMLHNNLDVDHMINNNKKILISFDNTKRDSPIYDFIHLYKKYYNKYDFNELYKLYNSKFNLSESERMLLYVYLFLVDRITFNKNEMKNVKKVSEICNYLYITDNLFMENETKNTKEQNNKINKEQENMKSSA